MTKSIAVINAGSSSIKFAIYEASDNQRCLFQGQVEGIGVKPHLKVSDAAGAGVEERSFDQRGFVQHALEILQARRRSRLQRARRNRVHANSLRPEFISQIPAGGLQRRLHRAHDVVVRDHPIRAKVAHGEHRPAVSH